MKKLIKLNKIDVTLKEENYLKYCLSLSEEERIEFLERLNNEMWNIWKENPDNQQLLANLDNDTPKRLQRLSKSFRKI